MQYVAKELTAKYQTYESDLITESKAHALHQHTLLPAAVTWAEVRRPLSGVVLGRHVTQVMQGPDNPKVSSNSGCNICLCYVW